MDFHGQAQSPLFLLPGELRNEIYRLALVSPANAITDPCVPPEDGGHYIKSYRHDVPAFGAALFRTCHKIFYEAPLALLYTGNRFRFTSSTHAHRFLRSLPRQHVGLIREIELDLFCNQYDISLKREWSQYMAWAPDCGIWAKKLGSLRVDAPGLQVLRIDVGRDIIWTFLEGILHGPEDLSRIVVTGCAEPDYLAAWRISAWDFSWPMNFLGKPETDPPIMDLLVKCVAGKNEDKLIRWCRAGNVVTLEVLTADALRQAEWYSGRLTDLNREKLPSEGVCTFADYECRKHWRIEKHPASRSPNFFN
jgi:hypothetical protein